MPATLRDVARHAKVSVRTVSNVVSGYEHVSEDMRARVLAAIHELDYRPNVLARTLRTGRTGVLALVVPEIDAADLGTELLEVRRPHRAGRTLAEFESVASVSAPWSPQKGGAAWE